MPQQELREPMLGPEQVGTDVFTAAQSVADRFFLLRRNVNRRQRARAIQHRQLRGVAPIRFDAIPDAGARSGLTR
jgi:hypothetical protein